MDGGAIVMLIFISMALLYGATLIIGFKIYYKYFYKEPPRQQEVARKKKARTVWANSFYKEAEDRYWQLCHSADDMFREGTITAAAREQVKKDAKEELTRASKTAFGW